MKKYVFIGGYDKTELLLFLAKIATLTEKKVLIVDTAVMQKTKYIVPSISPKEKYITTFENIDIAIGFNNFKEISEYAYEENLLYDMVLLDIDSKKAYQNFELSNLDEHCFVTGFDLYSLRKGIEVLEGLEESIKVTKIYFSKNMLPEEDQYLTMISQKLNVIWDDDIVYFPFERGDQSVINTNQRFNKIKIKGLSRDYIQALMFVAEKNLRLDIGEVKKAIKIMEKA